MSKQIHTLNHPSIKLESTNYNIIKHYETALNGISDDDIRKNRVSGRHALLLNMGLAGHCPIFEEYFEIRYKRYKMLETRMENTKIPWNSCESSVRHSIACEVDKITLNNDGWDFTGEPK